MHGPMIHHTPEPLQKGKGMPDETQELTEDEVPAENKRDDDLRAREAALMRFTAEIDLGRDGSIESLNAWRRLHRVLSLLEEDPSEVRDRDESIINVLNSNQLSDTSIAELADKTSRHGQEPSIAGHTSARLEPHEPPKDSKQRPKFKTRSIRQNSEEPSTPKRGSLQFAVPHSTPESDDVVMALDSLFELEDRLHVLTRSDAALAAFRRKNSPESRVGMATKAKEYAAKIFKRPDNRGNGRKLWDAADKTESRAGLSLDDDRPLISPSTRGEPSLPNNKRR
ncbi:hypothetical protein F4680DRAFT_453664 [Xylaria scruposa]|nr:hypothetical protein F4680DRAFT_453664 [Xylaria scruposa]